MSEGWFDQDEMEKFPEVFPHRAVTLAHECTEGNRNTTSCPCLAVIMDNPCYHGRSAERPEPIIAL